MELYPWLGGSDYKYSLKQINSLKGSSLVAGAMCAGQASSLGKLMYYDARPGAWCGLYDQFTEPQNITPLSCLKSSESLVLMLKQIM